MTLLIIEDNEIELENLKILLESFDDCTLIAEANNITLGIQLANLLHPDVILLDIQLEDQNSLDYVHLFNESPYIICTTLHTEHALQAFEVGVMDYLTKPITREKLDRALSRLPEPRALKNRDRTYQTVILSTGNTTQAVAINDLISISADGDYTIAYDTQNTRFLCSRRMREWAELLPASHFITLDRSSIVNKKQIASYSKLDDNRTATITFNNDATLNIGPTALRRLKSILEE